MHLDHAIDKHYHCSVAFYLVYTLGPLSLLPSLELSRACASLLQEGAARLGWRSYLLQAYLIFMLRRA